MDKFFPEDPFIHRSENSAKIRILNAKINIILAFTGGQFMALIGIIFPILWKHYSEIITGLTGFFNSFIMLLP